MIEVHAALGSCHAGGLGEALKASLPGLIIGVSTYGEPNRPVSMWLDDAATAEDQSTAQTVAGGHDPVFLSVDKTQIAANGMDMATITVRAPKQDAAAVTLLVSANGGAAVELPITLTGGVGTDTITSLDPATITVSVKNPANRSTDQLVIQAV